MLKEDIKRLEREADIAKSVRGPDYSERDRAVARVKAEDNRRAQWSAEVRAAEAAAYWELVRRGEAPQPDGMGGYLPSKEERRRQFIREHANPAQTGPARGL